MVNYFRLEECQGEIRQLATSREIEGRVIVFSVCENSCLRLLLEFGLGGTLQGNSSSKLQGCSPHLTDFIKEFSFKKQKQNSLISELCG